MSLGDIMRGVSGKGFSWKGSSSPWLWAKLAVILPIWTEGDSACVPVWYYLRVASFSPRFADSRAPSPYAPDSVPQNESPKKTATIVL